ncbi:MAG TPA: response regulator transcription factor [Nitrospirota bacterium]|nr:response regulator transcription factor [Nitrospirota bacterium]
MSMHCLIIEDERDTAHFIRKGLKEAGYIVTCCNELAEGLNFAVRKQWDIIIVDRMLSGNVDGLLIVKILTKLDKRTPVLILTALAMLDERVRGLRKVGHDYLIKPFTFSHFLARVEALTRRHLQLKNMEELQVADLKLNLRTRTAERGGRPISLQPREFRLLEHLVRHQNQIVTRTALLESVWDCHFDSNAGVLNVQISRLRRKIDKGFSPRLLHTIRGAGYMVSVDG